MRVGPLASWYYDNGPQAASFIKEHNSARIGTRAMLTVMLIPLRVPGTAGFLR